MRYGVSTRMRPALDGALRALPQLAARLERIRCAAAPHRVEVVAPHRPDDARARRFIGQRQQIENDVEGRVAAADDEDALAGVSRSLAPEHVGNAVGDPIALLRARPRRRHRLSRRDSGRCHVPLASITARASMVSPVSSRISNGCSSRPFVRTLSKSLRPTDDDARVVADVRPNRGMRRRAASRSGRSARGRSADGPRSGARQPVDSSSALAAPSTMYRHGENVRTWPHSRTAAPASPPASRTTNGC